MTLSIFFEDSEMKSFFLFLRLISFFIFVPFGPVMAVINGVPLNNGEFESVVCLYNEKTGEICTGTFISPTQVLTAAHCLGGDQLDTGEVETKLSIVNFLDIKEGKYLVHARSKRAFRHPNWIRRSGSNQWDIGLLEFEEGVAKNFSEIAEKKPNLGESIELVGYGTDKIEVFSILERAGVKRWGENNIAGFSRRPSYIYVDSSPYRLNKEGSFALGNFGDSGGPVFANRKVVGVWSRTTDKYEGIAIDINSATSSWFLKNHGLR